MENKIDFDIFKPKSLDDYYIQLKLVKKLKSIALHNDIQNIILHGISGSGKYTLIMSLLANILEKKVFKKKK